jgi:hypothetical protein
MRAFIMKVAGGAALFLAVLVSTADAQALTGISNRQSSQDSWVASWQLDQNSVAGLGHGFSIDWVRQLDRRRVLTAGAGSFALAESRWSIGRVGWAFRPRERLILSTQTTVGGGRTAGAPFGYVTARADLALQADERVSLLMGQEYVNVADAQGHVLRIGTAFRASKLVMLEGTRAVSTGNLNTRLSIGRVEVLTTPVSFAGGGVIGRVTPEVAGFAGGPAATSQPQREVFVTVTFPTRGVTTRVSLDVMKLAEVTRRTLTATLTIPVRR